MKRPFAIWTRWLGLMLWVASAHANQQDPVAGSPLEVQSSTAKSSEGFALACSVTNKSNQEIVAYTIVADFVDSSGKPAGRLSANTIMTLSTNSKGSTSGLAPGAKGKTSRFVLPTESNGTPASYKVSVDYLLFKDGSTWGPDIEKQSLAIKGTQQGWRQSRAQLKRLMAERGIQAVADALTD